MEELAELTRELVSIPSHEDETAAGTAVEEWLRTETDAAVSRDAAGNVIARRNGDADDSLALVGHHDVVPPAPSQVEGGTPAEATEYTVERRGGRLYGRGTADMKGAVAACLLAFRDADPSCELILASFVGEETGGVGARAAIDDGFAPDYALIAEGSTDYSTDGVTDVVVAHKGRRASRLIATGTTAHASEPEAGTNAVYRACDAVNVVRELSAPTTNVMDEPLTGSVVVTKIEGGDAWNVIPDRCEVTIDERTVPGSRADLEGAADVDGVDWEVDQDLPPMQCSDATFAETALAAARAGQKGTPQHVTKPHATDAGWLDQAGTACVVCGPSEPGEAHTQTESVSLSVLTRCYRIYRDLAERVGR